MHIYYGILKRVSLSLVIIALTLPFLAACGKKNAPQAPPDESYSYPREYPRR